ncbi:MAG TPA: RNB domain-containing ribonuclease, partial [Gallionella sp.]|nr:RNB domain-containing ribonuclease [Gallionella sp.]
YAKNDDALFVAMRDFETMYGIYNEFQRDMEKYWCLRWLQQEGMEQVEASVMRENLVKLLNIPLIFRVTSLPETPANTLVKLAIVDLDLLDLNIHARFMEVLEAAVC